MVNQIDFSKKTVLAYIKGVCDGDGWATYCDSTKRYEIGLQNTSKIFVEKFKHALDSVGKTAFFGKRNKKSWRTAVNGKLLQKWVTEQDVSCFKTDEEIVAYLEGFYESDGVTKYPCYTKANKELLENVKRMLKKFEIKSYLEGPYTNNYDTKYYFLRIAANSVTKFSKLINPVEHNEWCK